MLSLFLLVLSKNMLENLRINPMRTGSEKTEAA